MKGVDCVCVDVCGSKTNVLPAWLRSEGGPDSGVTGGERGVLKYAPLEQTGFSMIMCGGTRALQDLGKSGEESFRAVRESSSTKGPLFSEVAVAL